MKRRKIIEPSCSADPSPKGEVVDLRPLEGASAEAELAAFAKAASHPIRVKILHMLARKNAQMCCHIVDELPSGPVHGVRAPSHPARRRPGQGQRQGPRAGYCIVPAALKRFKALLNGV
jgi:ArsR family transcriptional regulator